MTALQLFWISSIGGAIAFFAGGYLMARAKRDQAKTVDLPTEELGLQPPQSHALLDMEARAAAAEQRVIEQLASTQDAENVRAAERTAAEAELAARQTAINEGLHREGILKRRVGELEEVRRDYVRLRTQIDESEHLRGEVARLTNALRAAKQQARPVSAPPSKQSPPVRSTPPEGSVRSAGAGRPEPNSVAEALSQTIEPLLDASTWAVVVADQVGFPVTAVGKDAVSLAAYSTLLAEAGERARSFFAFASPRQLLIRDSEETYVSLWPFEIDGERLTLVTLSNTPPNEARSEATVRDVSRLLTRSSTPHSVAN